MYSESQTIETPSLTAAAAKLMRTVAVTGGKGGVGKSNFAVNMALALGTYDKRVALLDADFGLANADILCGISPKYHLGHVVAGWKRLEEVTVPISESVQLIPSGSGIEELANVSIAAHTKILSQLKQMETAVDFMIIDTAAGVSENVIDVLVAADEVIIVATPDPTSIVDAYATIKIILRHAADKPIFVVVNQVIGIGDAEKVFEQVSYVSKRFLDYEIRFLGMIPYDGQLTEAVREQVPVIEYAPESPASRAIRLIAKHVHSRRPAHVTFSDQAQSFWNKLVSQ